MASLPSFAEQMRWFTEQKATHSAGLRIFASVKVLREFQVSIIIMRRQLYDKGVN
jgi:hypothetical protein